MVMQLTSNYASRESLETHFHVEPVEGDVGEKKFDRR